MTTDHETDLVYRRLKYEIKHMLWFKSVKTNNFLKVKKINWVNIELNDTFLQFIAHFRSFEY